MRRLYRKHILYFVLSLIIAISGTIAFKCFISKSIGITDKTVLKIIVMTILFYGMIEIADLYIWAIKENRPFWHVKKFIEEEKIYSCICLILAIICFTPVIIDYTTDTKPYGYYTKEMVKIESRENCIEGVGQITRGTKIAQTFFSRYDTVTNIVLLAAPYAKNNDYFAYASLIDDETEELLEYWELNALYNYDNSTITLVCSDLTKYFNMKGKAYRLEITSSNDLMEQALTMYYSTEDLYEDGELMINGEATGGDLIMTISGYERKDNYERVQIWLCIYLAISIEAFMYCLRRKFNARRENA